MPLEIAGSLGPVNIRTKDPDLSMYAADWMEDESMYVARRACSPVPTTTIDGSYPIYDREAMIAARAEQVGNEGVVARAYSELDRQSFRCKAWGLEEVIGAFTTAQSMGTAVRPEEHATRVVSAGNMRRMDQEYNRVVMQTTAWDGVAVGQAGVTATNFNPFDVGNRGIQQIATNMNADPIKDFLRMRSAMIKQTGGYKPNLCVLGGDLIPVLLRHENVVDQINRGQSVGMAQVSLADWSSAIMVDQTIAMESVNSQGNFFMGTGFWLGYIDPNPGTDGVTGVSCFSLDSFRDGAMLSIDTRYDEARLANIVRGITAYDIHVVAKSLGIFCENYVG